MEHLDLKLTMRYAHVIESEHWAAVEALSDTLRYSNVRVADFGKNSAEQVEVKSIVTNGIFI